MTKRTVDTNIVLWSDRYASQQVIMDQARKAEASGVVDGFVCPEQMNTVIPQSLWTPENTPLASVMSDVDSLIDATMVAMLAHAAAPKLWVNICCDPNHTGPAETCLKMWSMASVTEGRARYLFGTGEVKNLKNYGHDRKYGLGKFEDLLRVSHAMWDTDGPIDYVGKHCELKHAYLGGKKTYRPPLWSQGTGPKQMDLATSFCDGVAGVAKSVWRDPEHCRTEIAKIKRTLVEKGRDPEKFGFGAHSFCLIHEDPETMERILDNPLTRWMTAMLGRINPGTWRDIGLEPPTPEGWTYFNSYVPYDEATPELVQQAIANTTREHTKKGFVCGTPAEVASQFEGFVDAGINWVTIFDFTPLLLELADGAKSLDRVIEVFARLKGTPVAAA